MPWGEIAIFIALIGPFITWRIARRSWTREDTKTAKSESAQSLETLLSSQREFATQLRTEVRELAERLRVCEQECEEAKRQARASLQDIRQVTEDREILAEMANSVIWKIANLMAPEHDGRPSQSFPGDSPAS